MKIVRKKSFKKNYTKLQEKLKQKVDDALRLFTINPHDKKLNNHSLKGKLKELRSIDVTGDLRIIFQEKDDYVVVLLVQVGSHSQLY